MPSHQLETAMNPDLERILKKAGWHNGRDEPSQEAAFKAHLAEAWHPKADSFVRSFGGLSIGDCLWVQPQLAAFGLPYRSRVESVIRTSCCPVASSGYMGDGCTIWIDSNHCFYAVDSEGMVFIGDGTIDALKVLLLGAKPAPAPLDVRSSLEQAWNWNDARET